MKNTKGKLDWDLLPMESIEDMVKVLMMGEKKYARNSWKNNTVEMYYSALMRHLVKFKKGEWLDHESQLPHMIHIMINAMFIYHLKETEIKEPELTVNWYGDAKELARKTTLNYYKLYNLE